jgi:hypothetical protein
LKDENCIQIFVRKPNIKRSLGRPRLIWENSIRFYLKESGWEVNSSGLFYGTVMGSSQLGNEHLGSMKGQAILE